MEDALELSWAASGSNKAMERENVDQSSAGTQLAEKVGTYRFADFVVRVSSLHDDVHELCREYRCEDAPTFAVESSQAEIEREREASLRTDELEGRKPRSHSDGYLETLVVYRAISERLPSYDAFLFHGSAVAVDGAAYLFTAKSGTGKSTHTRLWRELFGERALMVNDDKPLIRVAADGSASVVGTPWDGKHHLSSNVEVPLQALCILERSESNTIRAISKAEALPMLLQQVYRPSDPLAMQKTLALLDRLNVKLFRLGCRPEIDAAKLSYRVMSEGA